MYRNYISIQLPKIEIESSKELWEYFAPGIDVDIIDVLILQYVYKLPILIMNKNNLDGPCNLELIFKDGKLYSQLDAMEVNSLYPLAGEISNFSERLKNLVNQNLLCEKLGENGNKLYAVTDFYCEIFE